MSFGKRKPSQRFENCGQKRFSPPGAVIIEGQLACKRCYDEDRNCLHPASNFVLKPNGRPASYCDECRKATMRASARKKRVLEQEVAETERRTVEICPAQVVDLH